MAAAAQGRLQAATAAPGLLQNNTAASAAPDCIQPWNCTATAEPCCYNHVLLCLLPRLVSFLCDLAHWALEVQHARMFADDGVERPTLEVGRRRHHERQDWPPGVLVASARRHRHSRLAHPRPTGQLANSQGVATWQPFASVCWPCACLCTLLLQDSVLLVSLAEPLLTAAKAHNQQQVEQLLRLCQEGAQLQEEAERTAEHLKDMYYELTAQLREAATAGEVSRVTKAVRVVGLQLQSHSMTGICLQQPAQVLQHRPSPSPDVGTRQGIGTYSVCCRVRSSCSHPASSLPASCPHSSQQRPAAAAAALNQQPCRHCRRSCSGNTSRWRSCGSSCSSTQKISRACAAWCSTWWAVQHTRTPLTLSSCARMARREALRAWPRPLQQVRAGGAWRDRHVRPASSTVSTYVCKQESSLLISGSCCCCCCGGHPCHCCCCCSAAALDIAALVEAWLFDVGSVCRYVKTLAGYTANLEQQQDNQQRGWLPLRPGGIGRCSFMSPLVATSDAASHATHLYAQLSLHRACRDGLLGLRTTLEQHADEAGGLGGAAWCVLATCAAGGAGWGMQGAAQGPGHTAHTCHCD